MLDSTAVFLVETVETLWRVPVDRPDLLAQLAALAGGLLLVAAVVRARGGSPGLRAGLAQDGTYVAARAFITLPLTVALLAGLSSLVDTYAPGLRLGWLSDLPAWAQIVTYIVLMDALAYGIHRAFHASPWLWRFHAVHHSQRELNPLTTTRIHLVELLVKRVLMWAPLAVLGEPTVALAWFVVLDGFWGFFVHSGLRIPLGPLRYVLVEPGYHRLHHSRLREHFDANFAERLVIWDLLLGSARFDYEGEITTGIDDPHFPREESAHPLAAAKTWVAQFLYPFRNARS
jgi:sterol desaturase/sphingolipid hydroxylase (fatty acid hydroxylase superfamily)